MVYIYLDGDGIGRRIEAYIVSGDLEGAARFSKHVTEALCAMEEVLNESGAEIVFSGGDNILAKVADLGDVFYDLLKIFFGKTGATASAGVGLTATQAFLGLALAKSLGGGRIVYQT